MLRPTSPGESGCPSTQMAPASARSSPKMARDLGPSRAHEPGHPEDLALPTVTLTSPRRRRVATPRPAATHGRDRGSSSGERLDAAPDHVADDPGLIEVRAGPFAATAPSRSTVTSSAGRAISSSRCVMLRIAAPYDRS